MKIIHISDVHFSKDSIESLRLRIIPSIIDDIQKYIEDKNDTMIVFSGDLINKGGQSFDSIEKAFDSFENYFINPIIEELKINKENMFFSPGNHDVDLTKDEEFEQKGLEQILLDVDALSKFQIKDNTKGYNRILSYKKFEESFYNNSKDNESSNFQSYYLRKINKSKIGILCLNSAWRCYNSESDFGNLLIGERQILIHKKELEKNDFNIGVVHHHLDWLKEYDKEIVVPLLEKHLDILFCGHIHHATSFQKTGIYGSLLTVVAPSTWVVNVHTKNSDYCVGYQIIDINGTDISIKFRKYNNKKDCFVPDVDNGDETGTVFYSLPLKGDKTLFSEELIVSTRIKEVYVPMSSEHLLNFNSDSISPANIDEIFVEPKIIEKLEINENGEEEEDIIYISDLINHSSNSIIFGIKESGKSVLLDKLLADINKQVSVIRKIPVLLDFNKLGNTPIRTHLSRYLGIGIKEIDEFISNHKIILLLDNVNFIEDSFLRLKILSEYTVKYNITTFMTSTSTNEKDLPVDYISNPYFKEYRKLFITSYRTKQIRELTSKWFSANSSYYSEEKIENMIKMIVALNLPRTPLSISMFLWIIEKQENFVPINQANMLDTFIEKLFEKHSDSEILSSKFNYQNKIALLADIAHKMFVIGNDDYSMKFSLLLSFIEERLKSKAFRVNSKNILEHFIEKGVLSVKENCSEDLITFRFNCFFEYFLMQKMVFDPEFKKYVLLPENYFYFENEIDYFTGLRRYDIDILKETTSRIYNEFEEGIKKAHELEYGFDTFFYNPTQRTITESANKDQIIDSISSTNKPTQDDLDELKDELLESITNTNNIQRKKKKHHPLYILERKISIALTVLKNSEEISDEELKSESFQKDIESLTFFACIYKTYLSQIITNKDKKQLSSIEELKLSYNLLPLIIQEWLLEYVGTNKLDAVIQSHIKQILKENNNELQKYLCVFLYADIKGDGYIKEIKNLIKSVKRKYIFDMILFKLVSYYFFRSKENNEDDIYLDLIAEVIIKANKLPKNRKGSIIQRYIKRKRASVREILPQNSV